MNNVNIEVSAPGDAALTENELWITVSGPDPLPDFPTVRRLLSERHGITVAARPVGFRPTWDGPDQPYCDLWLVRESGKVGA